MRNTQAENDAEHSLQVAMIAHTIAIIGKERYERDSNPEQILALGVYHDATEAVTGDLPTPVKYHTEALRDAYHHFEEIAADRLIRMLPEDLRASFAPYLKQDKGYSHDIVKAADRISAYIKCLEEQRAGNREFDYAAENIRKALSENNLPEVQDFIREFLPACNLTLDELNHPTDQTEEIDE